MLTNRFFHKLFCCLFLLVAFSYFAINNKERYFDPDEFYHIAVSKKNLQHGFFDPMVQLPDLMWDERFPNAYFLFHSLTSLGFFLAQEDGVYAVSCILGCFSLLLLFLIIEKFIGPLFGILLTMGTLFSANSFFYRLVLVRAHVLAILLVLVIVIALLKRKKWLLFAASFLYGASYHAIYLSWIVVGVWFILDFIYSQISSSNQNNSNDGIEFVGLVLIGSFLGFVLNPFFPATFDSLVMHLRLASGMHDFGRLYSGHEIVPLRTDDFIKRFFFPLLVFFLASMTMVFNQLKGHLQTSIELRQKAEFFWLLSFVFWLMSLVSPRANEYAVPFTLLFAGSSFSFIKNPRVLLGLHAIPLLGAGLFVVKYTAADKQVPVQMIQTQKAISAIPERPKKIFHCNWSQGAYLLYFLPDTKFIDVLDPAYLLVENEEKYHRRVQVMEGKAFSPYFIVSSLFAADYLICDSPAAIDRLELDFGFERIYPQYKSKRTVWDSFVYQVNPNWGNGYLRRYRVFLAGKELDREANRTFYFDLNSDDVTKSQKCVDIAPELVRESWASSLIDGAAKGYYLFVGGSDQITVKGTLSQNENFIYSRSDFPRDTGFVLGVKTIEEVKKMMFRVCQVKQDSRGFGISFNLQSKRSVQEMCNSRGFSLENCFTKMQVKYVQ